MLDPLAVRGETPVPEEEEAASGEKEKPVWESERLSQVPFRVFRGHTDAVSCCHFCCDDTKIMSCSRDRTARLWDASLGSLIHVYKEHTAPISECDITSDNQRMMTSSYDKTVKSWDVETGKVQWSVALNGLVTSCNVSADGKRVVCSLDVENAVCIIDATTASEVTHLNDHHASSVTRCCFDPAGERVCSVSSDGGVKLWDVTARRTTIAINQAHGNVISDCGFSANGRLLCTASWDKTLKLWDINTGEFRHGGPSILKGVHRGSISSCEFSKDASVLVSAGYDKTIAFWDVASARKKLVLKGHDDWVLDATVSANKKWILSSSKDSTLRLWDLWHYEQIPAVMENRKAIGSRMAQCEKCDKPFPIMHWDDAAVTSCLFCRLALPAQNAFPVPSPAL
ncbi:WD repeat-containing protein 88 [Spea bombifrons]|uniref:WD repeat-containing protein 88 n=1 Tax=Spea bombifrons TaxID=233779 RepID=UPI00234BABDE|nr:WD repeat-containing protein 88 [Spea bombifrons]